MTTDTITERDAVAEKVRKLLAKAEDPAATPEEAEAFSAKAQELMSRYSISLSMIVDADRPDEIVTKIIYMSGGYERRKICLINYVAINNDCKVVWSATYSNPDHTYSDKKRYTATVVGYQTDVDWVETLFTSLEVQMATAMRRDAKSRPAYEHGRTWTTAYIDGFALAIYNRLKAVRDSAVKAEQAKVDSNPLATQLGSSVAMVLVAKKDTVEKEFRVRVGKTRKTTISGGNSYSGRNAGTRAGQNASIARGSVGGNRKALR